MKNIFFLILFIKMSNMTAQESGNYYKILSKDEGLAYDLGNMKEYKYSEYNGNTSLFIDDKTLFVFPNIGEGSAIIISKDRYDKMFEDNSYPVLPENNTSYFLYRNLMNKEDFNKENMIGVLKEIGLNYDEANFFKDVEKLAKDLSQEDKKKLIVPMLYFMGEDLKRICPKAEWSFNTRRYLQPFNEPILYYQDHFYSFYDLNILLEEKLIKNKKISFKEIYKRVEKYYDKKSWMWG